MDIVQGEQGRVETGSLEQEHIQDVRTIYLVSGPPGSGKSTLAAALDRCYGYPCLSVDTAYIDFVRDRVPELYFEWLAQFIHPHYLHMLSERDFTLKHFGRDFVTEWRRFLFEQVQSKAREEAILVVEGALLKDCADQVEQQLGQTMRVIQIRVQDHKYYHDDAIMSLARVAELAGDKPAQEPC